MALVEIEIPPRPEFVAVIRLALGALGRAESIEEETLDDLKIAVSEACTNAVMAGERTGSEAPITVAWDPRPDAVVVEVVDRTSEQEPVGDDSGAARLDLSLALLSSLVDDLDHAPLPDGGHRTRLTLTR